MRYGPPGVVTALTLLAWNAAVAQAPALDSVRSLLRSGGPAAALTYARTVVQASPRDAWAQTALARAASAADSHDIAVRASEEAVRLAPNVAWHHVILGQVKLEKAGAQGGLGALGMAKGGKAAVERAVELDPNNIEARQTLIGYHLEAPGIAGGSKDEAKRQAAEIARRDSVLGMLAMMRVYTAQESDFDVQRLFEVGLRWIGTPIDSTFAITNTLLNTSIQVKSDKLKETLTARLHAAKPDETRFTYARARLWVIQGKELAKAETIIKDLLGRQPPLNTFSVPGAHWRLGQLYEKTARPAEALTEYREALRLNPQLIDTKKDLERLEKKNEEIGPRTR